MAHNHQASNCFKKENVRLNLEKSFSKYSLGILFLSINFLGLLNHIFFGIVIFSQFLFLFNFTDSRKKIKFFILNFLLLGSIYLLMMYPFLIKSLSFNNL